MTKVEDFNEKGNRDIITEFWEKWKNEKYQVPNDAMKTVINEQLKARGLRIQTDTERFLINLLTDALLETQSRRNFSRHK